MLKTQQIFLQFPGWAGKMEAGEEGKEGAAQHCDFLKDMQQVRLWDQIWIQVSRIPIHQPTLPSAPRREISLTAHLIKHTLPLSLKISRKRSVDSHSKMMAKLITFYSCYVPLHR